MKTALTELIEIVETAFQLKYNPAWQRIFESYLEAEKEQIKSAYNLGAMDTWDEPTMKSAEDYYTQTFNSDE